MDLRGAALSGFRWMAGVRVIAEVVGFGSTIVLARLIDPSDYGRAVIALAFAVVTAAVFQEGLVTPLVQLRGATIEHLRVSALAGLLAGVVGGVLFAVVLPWALQPVFGDQTAHLLRLLSPIPVIEGACVVSRAALLRGLDFRRLGIAEVCGAVGGSASAVTAAALGAGATAIVIGAIATSVVQATLLWRAARPPRPAWHGAPLRGLLGFGTPAGLSTLVFQLWRNIDYVLVGARLGAHDAGLYWGIYTLSFDYPVTL